MSSRVLFQVVDQARCIERTLKRALAPYGLQPRSYRVLEAAARVQEETGPNPSRNALQTITLLDAISENKFDAAIGGARRDEEKARAKERFFSHRDRFGQWDPKNQRPELWALYNGRKNVGEHFRVFPLSNWTEMDVWQYIASEGIEIPSLYFSHRREMVHRDGMLLAKSPYITLMGEERYEEMTIRFRTIGDMTCTGAVESTATTLDEVVAEVATTQQAERSARADDQRAEAAGFEALVGGVVDDAEREREPEHRPRTERRQYSHRPGVSGWRAKALRDERARHDPPGHRLATCHGVRDTREGETSR